MSFTALMKISNGIQSNGLVFSSPYTAARDVAKIMAASNVDGDVLPGYASYKGKLEWHVSITVFGTNLFDLFKLFVRLKDELYLTCAYIEVESTTHNYKGCILKHPVWLLFEEITTNQGA